MVRPALAFFACILSFSFVQAYWFVRSRYNQVPEMAFEMKQLEDRLEREKVKTLLMAEQAIELKAYVASVLPSSLIDLKQKEKNYPMRNLASLTFQSRNESMNQLVVTTLFETGKTLFREKQFERSNRLFQKLISNYGYAPQAVEAHFLLAEGQFQQGDIESSIETIQQMVRLFPDSELTGFSLIRLGNIFESRSRYEEAVQIYRTVLKTSPYRNVATQAERNLRDMEP